MSPQAAAVMDPPRSWTKDLQGLSTPPGWKDPRSEPPSLEPHCLSPAEEPLVSKATSHRWGTHWQEMARWHGDAGK